MWAASLSGGLGPWGSPLRLGLRVGVNRGEWKRWREGLEGGEGDYQ